MEPDYDGDESSSDEDNRFRYTAFPKKENKKIGNHDKQENKIRATKIQNQVPLKHITR